MKPVVLCIAGLLLMSGCSSTATRNIIGTAVAGAADTKVGYDSHQCQVIKTRCVQGDYQEWQTSDGVPGCSCKEF